MIKQVLDLPITNYPITNKLKGGLYGYFNDDETKELHVLVVTKIITKTGASTTYYKVIPIVQTQNVFVKNNKELNRKEVLNTMTIFTTSSKEDVLQLFKENLER